MFFASYRAPSTGNQTNLRRRATTLVLALLAELLIVLALLTLGSGRRVAPLFKGGEIFSLDLSPDKPAAASTAPKTSAATRPPTPAVPAPVTPKRSAVPPLPRNTPDLPMLVLSKEELAAADIGKLGSNAPGAASAAAAGDSAAVGTAPNGEPLYAAEWYREPTDRELSGYLPPRMPDGGGWGEVACRTVERHRVEDCVELGNSPAGSHLANAVRQSAWQFLVRAPRKGGRELVGTWVRIRITYRQEAKE